MNLGTLKIRFAVPGSWKWKWKWRARAARRGTCGAVPKEAESLVTFWSFSVESREGQDKEEEEKNLELRGLPASFSRYLRHCIDAKSGMKNYTRGEREAARREARKRQKRHRQTNRVRAHAQ